MGVERLEFQAGDVDADQQVNFCPALARPMDRCDLLEGGGITERAATTVSLA
jgi:hypothetical protein